MEGYIMNENDGLWVVEFKSSAELNGKGVFVLNGERILGGDAGYYYSGQCKEVDGKVSGEINVIRYDHNSISVFGEIDTFTLSIEGTIDGSVIETSATSESFPGLVMQITGSKRENL